MQKILSISLSIFALALIALSLSSTRVDAFAGGDGSPEDPYQISTCLELQDMDTDLDANYILVDDIDCSATSGWNTGAGFEPVGNSGTPFVGTLDGQGFVISDLFINTDALIRIGLFGQTSAAFEVHDIGLEDVDITTASTISRAGALVGINAGTISRSYSTGVFDTANVQTGGLVGANSGTISDSYSRASIVNIEERGAGLTSTNTGTIVRSYSTGSVSAGIGAGLTTVNTGTVTDSFWDTETSGQATSAGGTGKTTAEMKDVATFTNTDTPGLTTAWDFMENPNDDVGGESIWDIDPGTNDGYPFLTFIETTVPDQPTGLSATAIGMTQIDLSWTEPADDGDTPITGYMIEQKIGAGAFATLVADTATTSTTYSETGLTAGTLYTYRVSAINGVGTGNPSDEAFATTEAEPVVEEDDGGNPSSHRRSSSGGEEFSSQSEDGETNETEASLETRVQQLTAILNALTNGTPLPTVGAVLIRDLEESSTGGDVVTLQLYLITANKGSAARALTQVGATGFFGPLTKAALAEFQASVGIVPAAGYFGPITRAYIATH